jgi:putative transposase
VPRVGVSASGYYAWRDREPSARVLADAVLTERIRAVRADSHHTYGMPRVRAELIGQGVVVSRKRVSRLMRSHNIRGISRRLGFTVTTRSGRHDAKAPDLVQRKFEIDGANQLCVTDMTYVPTWPRSSFIYLAVVIDDWSRRVVGWAIGETMAAELVLSEHGAAAARTRRRDHPPHATGL